MAQIISLEIDIQTRWLALQSAETVEEAFEEGDTVDQLGCHDSRRCSSDVIDWLKRLRPDSIYHSTHSCGLNDDIAPRYGHKSGPSHWQRARTSQLGAPIEGFHEVLQCTAVPDTIG